MFWLHLNDHWCFFLNFRWFYFKKGNHVCLKENAVPIWHFFSTIPKCLGAELSFSTGAELSCFHQCRVFLSPIRTFKMCIASAILVTGSVICFHFICLFLLCFCLFDLCTLFVYIPCTCLQLLGVKLSINKVS